MWWMLQIVGCIGVAGAQVVNRTYGVCITSWIVYSTIAMSVTYFAFSKSYAIAPTFFSAWFIGQVALNVIGLLVAFMIFDDKVSTTQWVGFTLSIVGGYLLVK